MTRCSSSSTTAVLAYFYSVLSGELSPVEFAAWVYTTDILRTLLDPQHDDLLLGFDYYQPDALPQLRPHLLTICHSLVSQPQADDLIWRAEVVRLANIIWSGTGDVLLTARYLWSLCWPKDNCWDDPDFSVFGRLDALTSEHMTQSERVSLVNDYQVAARVASQQLIHRFGWEVNLQ